MRGIRISTSHISVVAIQCIWILHVILSTHYSNNTRLLWKLIILALSLGIVSKGAAQEYTPGAPNSPQAQPSPPAATPQEFWLPEMPEQGEETDTMKLQDQELTAPQTPPADALAENSEPGHVFNKWKVIPYASLQTTFDDNIFISAQNPQSDVYTTIAAGMAAGWGAVQRNLSESAGYFRQADTPKLEINPVEEGNYAFANYTASQTLFADHTSQNSINQDVSLSGEWRFEKILFNTSVRYQTLSDIDIDIGGRVNHDLLTAKLTAAYPISEKISDAVDFSRTSNYYPTALNSTDTSINNFVNYQATGKLNTGVGVKLGTLDVQTSPGQVYEQILLRGTYLAAGKLSFSATAGLEARQIQGNNHFDPVFTFGAVYSVAEQTTLYLDAFRQTFSSAVIAGENIATTGVTLRVRQRCFQKIYLTLQGGYQHGQYQELVQTALSSRVDDSLDFRASLSFDYTKWITMELSYEYRKSHSTESTSSFAENLFTLQLIVFF